MESNTHILQQHNSKQNIKVEIKSTHRSNDRGREDNSQGGRKRQGQNSHCSFESQNSDLAFLAPKLPPSIYPFYYNHTSCSNNIFYTTTTTTKTRPMTRPPNSSAFKTMTGILEHLNSCNSSLPIKTNVKMNVRRG